VTALDAVASIRSGRAAGDDDRDGDGEGWTGHLTHLGIADLA